MEFFSHLEEFRKRLIYALIPFALASLLSYFFSRPLIDFLTLPLRQTSAQAILIFQAPHEAFLIHLKAAALAGFILTSPVFVAQAWLFVAPGLYPHEKRTLRQLIVFTVSLFLSGVVFAYALAIPWGLQFLLSFQTQSLKPLLAVDAYFSFLIGMMFAFGILFDFPVIVVGLVQLGIMKSETLAKSRRLIIVMIFVVAAILTPSPDPVSQCLLAVPLVVLFEISYWLARFLEERKPAFSEAGPPKPRNVTAK